MNIHILRKEAGASITTHKGLNKWILNIGDKLDIVDFNEIKMGTHKNCWDKDVFVVKENSLTDNKLCFKGQSFLTELKTHAEKSFIINDKQTWFQ